MSRRSFEDRRGVQSLAIADSRQSDIVRTTGFDRHFVKRWMERKNEGIPNDRKRASTSTKVNDSV